MLRYFDYVFTGVFTFEMLIKVMAAPALLLLCVTFWILWSAVWSLRGHRVWNICTFILAPLILAGQQREWRDRVGTGLKSFKIKYIQRHGGRRDYK